MDENEMLFNEDNLFDDEYAEQTHEEIDDDVIQDNEEYSENEDGYEDLDESSDEESSENIDTIAEYLKTKGIDARAIKFENEDGEEELVDYNDLTPEEQLQILSVNNTSNDDLTDDEIDLLNQLRRNNWTAEDYNNYIRNQAIAQYKENNNQDYSVNDISDDELFIINLKQQIPDISDEEIAEELDHAKSNTTTYNKRIQNLRENYIQQEKQYKDNAKREAEQREQQQLQQFTNQILNTIQNNRYMDIGLGQDSIEMTDEDMNDVANFILGKDEAGNRYIANALNDPNALVQMAWYLTKGREVFQEINDYYKAQITKTRKSAYNKGYDDAVSGRKNSGKAVVSKRQPSRNQQKREQTIYDLD